MRLIPVLLCALLLSGCVDETSTYKLGSAEHSLTLRVEQDYLWDDEVRLVLMTSRWPDCVRRHVVTRVPIADMAVELFSGVEGGYVLRLGAAQWRAETDTCTLVADTPNGPTGASLGVFQFKAAQLSFVAPVAPIEPTEAVADVSGGAVAEPSNAPAVQEGAAPVADSVK